MTRTLAKYLPVIVMLFTLQACASTSDLGPGKTGVSITFPGKSYGVTSYNDIWAAVVRGVKKAKDSRLIDIDRSLHITSQNKSSGRIEADAGASIFSLGEVVGIFVIPPRDAPSHQIEVESLRKLKTNLMAINWEQEVIVSIKKELGKLASKE